MSEDKMREEFEAWIMSKQRLPHENWWEYQAWKACAAIKDAEIADLKTRLSGRTSFVPPEFQKQLDDSQAEIAARDLMIKELREALKWYISEDETFEGGEWEEINKYWLDGKRKAKMLLAEHHNSRALEKKLLETRIDEIKRLSCWHPLDGNWEEFVRDQAQDYEIRLAELNKE